jgi:O-antigen/teichoic acid export membrane protein
MSFTQPGRRCGHHYGSQCFQSINQLFDFRQRSAQKFGDIINFNSAAHSLSNLSFSYFRAKNEAFRYSLLAVLIMMGLLIADIFFVVLLKKGVNGVLYSQLLIYWLGALFIGVYIHSRHYLRLVLSAIRKLFSFGFPLIFSMVGWFILNMSSPYFLAHYSGLKEVGIYGLGYRISAVLMIVIVMPFQLAFGPYVFSLEKNAELKEKISRIFSYLLLGLFFSIWATALLAKTLIRVIAPPEYQEAYAAILAILPAIFLTGVYYWAASLLHLVKKTKWIGLIIVASALLSIFLNIWLVPKYGWPGAAASTVIAVFAAVFSPFS